jgi:hypothetical protein
MTNYVTSTSLNNVLNGTTTFTSLNANSISENIQSLTAGSSVAFNYSTSAIGYVTAHSTNFTIAVSNIPTTATNRTYTVTLIIDSTTYKRYASAITINGTSHSLVYNGGSANINVASATKIVQAFNIVFTTSSTVPTVVLTSVVGLY